MEALTPNKTAIKEHGVDGWLVRKILPKAWAGKLMTTRNVRVAESHEMTSLSPATEYPAFTKDHHMQLESVSKEFMFSVMDLYEHPSDSGEYGHHFSITDGICGLINTLNESCQAFAITDEQLDLLVEQLVNKAMGGLSRKQRKKVLQELDGKLLDVVISARTQAAHNPENQKLQLFKKVADAVSSGLLKHKSAKKVASALSGHLKTQHLALAGGASDILPAAFIMKLEAHINTWAFDSTKSRLPAIVSVSETSPMRKRAEQALEMFTPPGKDPQKNLEASVTNYLQAIKTGNKDAMVVGCQCLFRDAVLSLSLEKRAGFGNDDFGSMLSPVIEKVLNSLPENERNKLREAIKTSELSRISATLMTCMHSHYSQIEKMGPYTPSAVMFNVPVLSEFARQLDSEDSDGSAFSKLANDIAASTYNGGKTAEDININEVNQTMDLLRETSVQMENTSL